MPALDGLRGVAVALVVFYDFFQHEGWMPFVSAGWTGVNLFFVLSGFLITGILLDTRAQPGYYPNFLLRRVLRIFPLYYGVLLGAFALNMFIHEPGLAAAMEHQAWFWTYTQNFLFAGDLDAVDGPFAHFWSLAVEEQFYLFWPIAVLFLSRRQLSRLCVLGVVFSVSLRLLVPVFPFVFFSTPARLEGLLLGSLLAIQMREAPKLVEAIAPKLLLLSAMLLGGIAVIGHISAMAPEMMGIGYTLLDLFYGSLLALVITEGMSGKHLRRMLSGRMLRKVGLYSYGIYVYSYLVWYFSYPWLNATIGAPDEHAAVRAVLLLLLITFTFGLSAASYELYERRFLALKERFAPRSGAQGTVEEAPAPLWVAQEG
jgi:peptidoglycan/LPS O-acetylase OafA/YrhL